MGPGIPLSPYNPAVHSPRNPEWFSRWKFRSVPARLCFPPSLHTVPAVLRILASFAPLSSSVSCLTRVSVFWDLCSAFARLGLLAKALVQATSLQTTIRCRSWYSSYPVPLLMWLLSFLKGVLCWHLDRRIFPFLWRSCVSLRDIDSSAIFVLVIALQFGHLERCNSPVIHVCFEWKYVWRTSVCTVAFNFSILLKNWSVAVSLNRRVCACTGSILQLKHNHWLLTIIWTHSISTNQFTIMGEFAINRSPCQPRAVKSDSECRLHEIIFGPKITPEPPVVGKYSKGQSDIVILM